MKATRDNQKIVIFETGVEVQDQALADYYKLRLLEIKQSQKLLGDFTDDGKYVISTDLKKALVKTPKLVTRKEEDFLVASCEIKNFQLNFSVRMWKSGDEGVANLYFYEWFNAERQMETFVAQYVASYDETFLNKVKKVFNLREDIVELDNELGEPDPDLSSVIEKNEADFDNRKLLLEVQAQEFISSVKKNLKKGGAKNKQLLEKIDEEIENQKVKPEKSSLYLRVKRNVDELLIKENKLKEVVEENKKLKKEIARYTNEIKTFDNNLKKVVKSVSTKEPQEKKQETKQKKPSSNSYTPPKTVAPYKYKTNKYEKIKDNEKKLPSFVTSGGDIKPATTPEKEQASKPADASAGKSSSEKASVEAGKVTPKITVTTRPASVIVVDPTIVREETIVIDPRKIVTRRTVVINEIEESGPVVLDEEPKEERTPEIREEDFAKPESDRHSVFDDGEGHSSEDEHIEHEEVRDFGGKKPKEEFKPKPAGPSIPVKPMIRVSPRDAKPLSPAKPAVKPPDVDAIAMEEEVGLDDVSERRLDSRSGKFEENKKRDGGLGSDLDPTHRIGRSFEFFERGR